MEIISLMMVSNIEKKKSKKKKTMAAKSEKKEQKLSQAFYHPYFWQKLSFHHCISLKPCEPRHDKTNNVAVHPAKTQISLAICPVWLESSLSAWRKLRSLATHWAHSEDSDQTGRMPRLIWVFTWCTLSFCWFCHVAAHVGYKFCRNAFKHEWMLF